MLYIFESDERDGEDYRWFVEANSTTEATRIVKGYALEQRAHNNNDADNPSVPLFPEWEGVDPSLVGTPNWLPEEWVMWSIEPGDVYEQVLGYWR